MEQIVWHITPLSAPRLIRRCARCAHMRFISSGQFRINANGNRLDVWLIYKCGHCQATWNLELFSRTASGRLGGQLYNQLMKNDTALALQYSLDKAILRQNGAVMDINSLEVRICGELPANGACAIRLCPAMPLDISLSKVFAQKLSVSQSEINKLVQQGRLCCTQSLRKTKLRNDIIVIYGTNMGRSDNIR